VKHAISYGARNYNWPSIQKASAEILKRIQMANLARVA
jgi:hypothetical protein